MAVDCVCRVPPYHNKELTYLLQQNDVTRPAAMFFDEAKGWLQRLLLF